VVAVTDAARIRPRLLRLREADLPTAARNRITSIFSFFMESFRKVLQA